MATHPTLTIRQDTSLTTTSSPSSTTSSSASTGSKVLYIAVGVALAGVSLIILVVIICCWYRRRHRQRTKPPKTSAAHVLQDHHLPPSTAASGKPTHYAAHAGYSASAEQGHSLLANAAPVPHGLGSSPAAYAGKSYGLQQLQQPETSKPPHASQDHSASSTHNQSPHRPPHGPPQQQQQAPAAPPPTAHGPSIPHTHLPVPGQNSPHIPQPTGAAQPRPPSKTGEAATYFDSSVYIGTQRGRRSGGDGGGGSSGERESSRRGGGAVSLGEVREVYGGVSV